MSDYSRTTASAGDGGMAKTSGNVGGKEAPSDEQSLQDKRRQLLEQQRQKKMDTKIAMGLAPPSEEVLIDSILNYCMVWRACNAVFSLSIATTLYTALPSIILS